MKILLILLTAVWIFSRGKPVEDAVVIIENSRNKTPVAWQQTGSKGTVSIGHLDADNYRLIIEFPFLEGKWIQEKRRHRVMTKASYNPRTKTYYYQGEEGFFSIKFNKTRRIESENFNPIFREIRADNNFQYVIANFQSQKEGAQISLIINKLTARQFKKMVEKIEHDISIKSIPDFN